MQSDQPFRTGVVEGFFGIPWSWAARTDYAAFLKQYGFNSYLYAPKSDVYLRKQWQQSFPRQHYNELLKLSELYAGKNLDFGIGLSPFELYQDFSIEKRQALKNKILEINLIKPRSLCILFDDMQGNIPDMALRQAEIQDFVTQHSNAENFIFCPTYYSSDEVLEKHFGKMPDQYLEDLGRLLDKSIEIFWTGPHVFSREFPSEHMKTLIEKLQRLPLIWENYPVNDAKRLCDFLHLMPFKDNSSVLRQYSSGHMVNPMNQAWLSKIPLFSLAAFYRNEQINSDSMSETACKALCSESLAEALLQDMEIFQTSGLGKLKNADKELLKGKYSRFEPEPMAREMLDWLNGSYAFDPACLT